jgi:hypothetical protein
MQRSFTLAKRQKGVGNFKNRGLLEHPFATE